MITIHNSSFATQVRLLAALTCCGCLLAGPAGTAVSADQEPVRMTGDVYFHVVDIFGEALPYEVFRFAPTVGSGDFTKTFAGLNGTGIPYGIYTYMLLRSDCSALAPLRGEVAVDQPERWITVVSRQKVAASNGECAEPLMAPPKPVLFRGVFHFPAGSDRPLSVRLRSVYGSEDVELRVAENGTFGVNFTFQGLYIMSVFGKRGLLYTRGVKFYGSSPAAPVTIDLPSSQIGVLTIR
jgi:hypothetical protein